MQKMDCHNFKEILDSYFCEELTVETNHAILHHAERCASCRNEMASRRNLRMALQRACAQDQMSDDACERLRAMLRADAGAGDATKAKDLRSQRRRWADFFNLKFALPMLTGAVALLVATIGVATYLQSPTGLAIPLGPSDAPDKEQIAARLSDELMTEAAGSHRKCVLHVKPDSPAPRMPNEVIDFDSGCVDLDKIVAGGAQSLPLYLAHVCGDSNRRFAHLIYQHDGQLVSLLVTPRDGRAMQTGQVPAFVGGLADLQESQQTGLNLGAYQTEKRVVLVVSTLPKAENEKLARSLAAPVVRHLRRVENQTALLEWPDFSWNINGIELMASVRGGNLR
jgi:hypothetical protein